MNKNIKFAAILSVLMIWAFPANALEVEEAGVEKGEAEVVYEGTYTSDNGGDEGAYEHEHEIEAELGITDWLKLGVGLGFEAEEDEASLDFSEIEAAATIELIDPEKNGFGFSLYGRLSREFAQEDGDKDEKEFALGVIAEQTFNKNWLVRGNLFYIGDLGNVEDEQFDGVEYAYQVRYQMTSSFGLGIEGYGSHKDFKEEDEDDLNEHKIGPVLYYSRELEPRHQKTSLKDNDDDEDEEEGMELEGQFGVLFGTNDDTADVTFKWNIGLEF